MTKYEFIRDLRENLAILSFQQQEDIINDYLNYFDNELENGLDEKAIIEKLGNPIEIAHLFYDELVDKEDLKPKIKIVKKNVGLFIGVLFFDIFIGVYIAIALFLIALGLIVLPIITIYYSFTLLIFHLQLSILEGLASIFFVAGISLISFGLGIMMFNFVKNGIYYHLNWMQKLIKGGYHEVV